jgi:hypothetical protein
MSTDFLVLKLFSVWKTYLPEEQVQIGESSIKKTLMLCKRRRVKVMLSDPVTFVFMLFFLYFTRSFIKQRERSPWKFEVERVNINVSLTSDEDLVSIQADGFLLGMPSSCTPHCHAHGHPARKRVRRSHCSLVYVFQYKSKATSSKVRLVASEVRIEVVAEEERGRVHSTAVAGGATGPRGAQVGRGHADVLELLLQLAPTALAALRRSQLLRGGAVAPLRGASRPRRRLLADGEAGAGERRGIMASRGRTYK